MDKLKETEKLGTKVEKTWFYKGLKCVVLFVRHSHRNGYVRIPKSNPAFAVSYDDIPVNVHGGLTYGSPELPEQEKDANFYWFGFDTTHHGDNTSWSMDEKGHFWTTDEAVAETEIMANQFLKLTKRKLIKHKLRYEPEWFKKGVKIR